MISRLRILGVMVWMALAVVVGSYWVVQGVRGSGYAELAEHNRLRRVPIRAPRGIIADAEARPLAENVPSYNLRLSPKLARSLDASLDFAAQTLGCGREALAAVENERSASVLLAENLTLAQVARFELALYEHPEFEIEVEQLRLYRHRNQTAHILGYLGEVGPEELAQGKGVYKSGELVGKRGIERRFERQLRGRNGEQMVVVDSRGRLVEEYDYTAAVPGRDIRLTIDLDLQQAAFRQLEEKVGVVVAMDPRNGAIRALVSSPSYDPNLFARRLDPERWQGLLTAPHQPLQNRAIQNVHSPGSIFKIVMALAALDEDLVTLRDRVWCSGAASFYNHRFRCWKRGGHGWVDLHEAVKQSCDIYFYHLGQRLGIDTIASHARRFGLGRQTGVELEGEKQGLVPDTAWSLAARRHPWYPGETISVSIGQGPILVSPLQLAVLMAAVATRGDLPTPHLIADAGYRVRHRVELSELVWRSLQDALEAVVTGGGTGGLAAVDGLRIAGKTGTVQVVSQATWMESEELPFERRDHAWFAAYAPVEEPELVVVVFVEHGGAGSRAAAPIARAVYEEFFEKRSGLRHPPPA